MSGRGRNRYFRMLVLFLAAMTAPAACKSEKGQPGQAAEKASADMEAIKQLHERDMQASKDWDIETLVSLWTDDIVALPAGGKPLIGKEANRASLLRMREQSRDLEITEYKLTFNEVKIAGDWAYEWGTFEGAMKPVGGGEVIESSGKVMRILRREADGSWKVARTMFNSDDTEGDDASPPQ